MGQKASRGRIRQSGRALLRPASLRAERKALWRDSDTVPAAGMLHSSGFTDLWKNGTTESPKGGRMEKRNQGRSCIAAELRIQESTESRSVAA